MQGVGSYYWDPLARICPSGDTLPTTPSKGQWFLHAPTGRTVLQQYDGANWKPIISYGTMTVFVDGTSGSDDANKGTASGSSAWLTIQFAIDQLPPTLGGNVTVNLSANTFTQQLAVQGKSFSGAFTLKFVGTLNTQLANTTLTSGTAGTQTTQPTVNKTGVAWTTNQFRNFLCKFTSGSNNGLYRVIDSNSGTQLILCGGRLTATPALNDTFTIHGWGTVIDPAAGQAIKTLAQVGLRFEDMQFNQGLDGTIADLDGGEAQFTRCRLGGHTAQLGSFRYTQCVLESSTNSGDTQRAVDWLGAHNVRATGCRFAPSSGTDIVALLRLGYLLIQEGCVVDGQSIAGIWGLAQQFGSTEFFTGSSVHNVFVKNCDVGVRAFRGGGFAIEAQATYSGNVTNEQTDTGTTAWILS